MAREILLIALLGAPTSLLAETRARYVMGTMLTVEAPATAAEAALGEVERWDRLLSTYKPDSEVSRLNAAAPERVALSTDALAALGAARAWAERTGGAFDPTVGPLVRAWGFDGDRPAAPGNAALSEALRRVGWTGLLVGDGWARLVEPGMAVDLGGIGKGWALDRALERARAAGTEAASMDFGGQLLFWSADPAARWTAAVRGRKKAFRVPAGSLSTSAQSEKSFKAPDGRRLGHILDPRTGRPAEGLRSVTAWAPAATEADALSTALFVMGLDAGFRWAEREGAAAFFVDEKGRGKATRKWREIVR